MPKRERWQGEGPGREPATLRLITVGRSTGLPHAVVVRFVFSEGAYFVIGGGRKSDWFVNALANKEGKVRLGDRAQAVACEQFFDMGLVRRLFAAKYGSEVVKEWYSDPEVRSLKLTPTAIPQTRDGLRKTL